MEPPAPSKAQMVEETFGKSAGSYDQSPFFAICGRRLAELADVPPGAQVLDIATGTGAVLFPLVERAGAGGRITGIDVAEPMVARAQADIVRRGITTATVRQMNAERLSFDDASFDRVTCGFGLWFIPDLSAALAEMRRVLRPGGKLAVSTWGPPAGLQAEHTRLLETHGGQPSSALSSHNLTTADAVREALSAAGFAVLSAAAETITVAFADEEQWWSQRMALPQLASAALGAEAQVKFKRDMMQVLKAAKGMEGIRESRAANYAVAAKAS